MPDDDLSALSEYERCAFRQLGARKKKELERSPRQLVPAKVREAAEKRAGALKNNGGNDESRQVWLDTVGAALRSGGRHGPGHRMMARIDPTSGVRYLDKTFAVTTVADSRKSTLIVGASLCNENFPSTLAPRLHEEHIPHCGWSTNSFPERAYLGRFDSYARRGGCKVRDASNGDRLPPVSPPSHDTYAYLSENY